MMCLFETSFENYYPRVNLKDNILIRADNLYNCRVSIYSKEHLVFCPTSAHNRNECQYSHQKRSLISLYQPLSQTKEKFDQFLLSFKQFLSGRIMQNTFSHYLLVIITLEHIYGGKMIQQKPKRLKSKLLLLFIALVNLYVSNLIFMNPTNSITDTVVFIHHCTLIVTFK